MTVQNVTIEDLIGPLNEFESKNAPKSVDVQGNSKLLLKRRRVSVVGARKCSAAGIRRTEKLAKLLVENNVVVVSGLAYGVDRTAHETAINLGGDTVAVIGTPIDRCYPAAHKDLQKKIAKDHLLVSQFKVGSRTYPSCFPQRNRTMALLSDATVIIEAGESSGSLSQGWEAIRLGRPLWILRSVAENTELSWPRDMINYGANVLDDENFYDLVDAIPKHELEFLESLESFLNV